MRWSAGPRSQPAPTPTSLGRRAWCARAKASASNQLDVARRRASGSPAGQRGSGGVMSCSSFHAHPSVGPALAPLIAAAFDKAHPARGADRPSARSGRTEARPGGGGARCRRRTRSRGRPSRRARGDLQPLLPSGSEAPLRRRLPAARRRGAGPRAPASGAWSAVLQLVADDLSQTSPSPTPSRAIASVTRARTSSMYARASAGSERLDLAAHRAGRLKRVVHAREVGRQQLQSREPVPQPQILVGGDVTEIPGERAHDR